MKIRLILGASILLLALTGCGGGSGGSGGSGGGSGGSGDGSDGGSDSNNKSWGIPELLESDDAGIAYRPQITFDTNGNAIAIWEQNDVTHAGIYANYYSAGAGWGMAELIDNNSGNAHLSQISMDSDGNDTNYIFLSFVLGFLPVGLVGLILAAILSASLC